MSTYYICMYKLGQHYIKKNNVHTIICMIYYVRRYMYSVPVCMYVYSIGSLIIYMYVYYTYAYV